VDSSSGAIGTAVNHAVRELVDIIAEAPAEAELRERWLERLWQAHEADQIPYIESLADHWGELCVSKELASAWADRLLGITRMALGRDGHERGFFHGTPACLSALHHAERHAEIVELLAAERFWHYKRWAVKALAAMGEKAEAIRCAESSQPLGERCRHRLALREILLSCGLTERGLRALRAHGQPRRHLPRVVSRRLEEVPRSRRPRSSLISEGTPAKRQVVRGRQARLFEEALELARCSPAIPGR
jgi:hypothetical protein